MRRKQKVFFFFHNDKLVPKQHLVSRGFCCGIKEETFEPSSKKGEVEGGILNCFDRSLQVLHLNAAEICRRSLALVTGLMSQQSINPEFANVAVLVSQKRRDRMAEPMERNGWRKLHHGFIA